MTEEELDQARESARSGNPCGEYNLAMLYAGDYLKYRAIYTLRALYQGILRIYEAGVNGNCPEVKPNVAEYLDAFKAHPSTGRLNELIVATFQTATALNPIALGQLTTAITGGIASLAEALPQILCRHYPEWRKFDDIDSCVSRLVTSPSIESLYDLLDTISTSASRKGDKTLIEKLLADALLKGFEAAIKPLAKLNGYQTRGVFLHGNFIIPVYDAKDNLAYPSINLGYIAHRVKLDEKRSVSLMGMLDFFTPDVSNFNHYISVVYNIHDKLSRQAGYAVMQAAMASTMAWMGPQRFTLDVVDYEHTGIGSYPARFLPERQVRIISRDEEWSAELDSIEKMIEKRSREMQSIFEYNRINSDMREQYKLIVVQDYNGQLITAHPPVGDHPDQKEKDRYELQLKNARRFLHLLERGYRFGLIFIVGSGKNIYNPSRPAIDCTKSISFPGQPYLTIRVEGIDSDGDDWLMRWLGGGEEIQRKRKQARDGDQQDGADGILTTEIADDGTDIEFRMDTVSHTHAFVIGKTGSGKSVLLHNIITGLVNAYSPDDLELYLLDLKMGGVEFNRYRRLPHLRSLLVDNSDIQIVLEIMRDIDMMMRERGKVFRNAAVSNIKEYNRAHPDKKMPQVIVVIDECHAIFSMGGGRGAAKEQREITERLVKIAKEGRSQGIHLIFATQTLSGSEIPPDIQKNITDYYLLKCAPSDSESLVRGSSSRTEALPVGKVYYYHADRQALFQGIYNDNNACEQLISEALQRYSGNNSRGQFYFNGAQTFELNAEIVSYLKAEEGKTVTGSPGRMINLQQTPVIINLRKDYSENVICTGINSDEQLSRTTIALMASQILAARASGMKLKVNVINCLDSESPASVLLNEMASCELISLYRPTDSESLLKRMCNMVSKKNITDTTVLYILGQERFGELKRDQKLTADPDNDNLNSGGLPDIFQGISFSTTSTNDSSAYDSYKKAIIYLLENGPTVGLHTVIQIDKPDKLLYEDFISTKTISARFKHIIILRSDPRAAITLGLSDDINLESLSADPERLRAYYYCDEDGVARLFSPFDTILIQTLATI